MKNFMIQGSTSVALMMGNIWIMEGLTGGECDPGGGDGGGGATTSSSSTGDEGSNRTRERMSDGGGGGKTGVIN